MSEPIYRKAPPGFTPSQWEQFMREGFLVIEDALSEAEIARYLDAIERCCRADPKFDAAKFYGPENIVERDPVFTELIDHPRHVGFVYDIYGEQLKLQLSQFFIRPRASWHNLWHPDGARALPYGVFAPELPLQLKVGYWLTDLPRPRMGNLVVLPSSHHQQYFEHYDTHNSVAGEKILCLRRGTMTLLHCNTWHRVEPNESDIVRKNIFLAYCPSWLCTADRLTSNPDWLQTLTREQRIIMRSYRYGYDWAKPPASDFPLYLDRETGLASDPNAYADHVALHRRKRKTFHEKLAARTVPQSEGSIPSRGQFDFSP